MSLDVPLEEYEFRSGAQRGSRLTLYANRLLHQGGDVMETVPLAQLAAVRIAFERDARKLNWALALLAIALALAAASGPLQAWLAATVTNIGEHARRESLDAVLVAVFRVLGGVASILPGLAAALAAAAAALLAYFWLGTTTLTLAFAATERASAVQGRDLRLFEFAEALSERIAARTG